jgi:hypothetical protein
MDILIPEMSYFETKMFAPPPLLCQTQHLQEVTPARGFLTHFLYLKKSKFDDGYCTVSFIDNV